MANDQPIIIKKKKKGGHEGHHGGAWKVAYADFVTAMMAFFLVMWIIGLDQETKAAIEGYFQDPAGFVKTSKGRSGPLSGGANLSPGRPAPEPRKDVTSEEMVAEEAKLKRAKKVIESELKKHPELKKLSEQVVIMLDKDGLRMELLEGPQDMFFVLGSAKLQPKAITVLTIIARELSKLPNPVILEGHTDKHQYSNSSIYSNWELSTDRASAARRVMQPILKPEQVIGVFGYADKHLRDSSNPYNYVNRRVSILVKYEFNYGGVTLKGKSEDISRGIAPLEPNIREGLAEPKFSKAESKRH